MPGDNQLETKRIAERIITRIGDGQVECVTDRVVIETPVTIFLNGRELVTLLCTPEQIDYLALGFLRSEGFLSSMEDVDAVRMLKENIIEIELKNKRLAEEKLFGRRTITSGCGKGTIFYNVLDSLRSAPLTGELKLSALAVRNMVVDLQKKAELFKATGGVHSAALADSAGLLYFHEDIGRHNAVDKIAGECLAKNTPTDDKILVTSGRLTSEILLKSAKLKLQLVVSRAAPTSLSTELAEALNITLIGFARGGRLNIYSHPWRIT